LEQAIDTVIDLMTKIKEAYTEMLELSGRKQTYIIKGNAKGLEQVVDEEWKMVKKISELEESRMTAIASLQIEWGTDSLTISEMEKRVQPYYKKKLEKISAELRNTIAAQKKANDQNMALLRLHFEYMNFVMASFLPDVQSGDIYGQSGIIMEAGIQRAGIIDSQV